MEFDFVPLVRPTFVSVHRCIPITGPSSRRPIPVSDRFRHSDLAPPPSPHRLLERPPVSTRLQLLLQSPPVGCPTRD